MKKSILHISTTLLLVLLLNTQSNSQSIELPDFVITGVQSVSIPTMKKNQSDYIPIISEEFLTPTYEVEDFVLTESSNPVKKELELYNAPHGYNGLLKLGAGTQTLPTGDFYFNKSIGQFLFDTHIWGSNIREYIANAGYNTSGGKLNFNYFINKRNLPFHGLAIALDATFFREGYKLYGSITPTAERENHFTSFNLSFINRLQRTLNYGLNIRGNYVNLTNDDLKESRTDWDGFIKYDFGEIALGLEGFAANQEVIKNDGLLSSFNYFGTNAFVEFSKSSIFYFKAGAHYSKQSSNSLFTPFVYFSFFMKKEITIFASYSGDTKFLTNNYFISKNKFFKSGLVDNVFQKTKSKLSGAIKYEFEKSIEFNGGIFFSNFDNYLYFEDNLVDGIFDVNAIDNVKRTGVFLNFKLDTSIYGIYYVNIEFQSTKNSDSMRLTYTPSFIMDFSYTYRLTQNILGNAKLSYFDGNYADLANSIKLSSYVNLSLYVRYNLLENLALTCTLDNLLNRYNYIYKNYREKPFDIVFGVEYNW